MHLLQIPFIAPVAALKLGNLEWIVAATAQTAEMLLGQGHQVVVLNRAGSTKQQAGGRIMFRHEIEQNIPAHVGDPFDRAQDGPPQSLAGK